MTNDEASKIVRKAVEEAAGNGRPILFRLPDEKEYDRVELSGTIRLNEQEKCDILKYTDIPGLMTIGFKTIFGREAVTIAFNAYDMIIERYGESANFMQIFDYEFPDGNEVTFYIMNDWDLWTVLIPNER